MSGDENTRGADSGADADDDTGGRRPDTRLLVAGGVVAALVALVLFVVLGGNGDDTSGESASGTSATSAPDSEGGAPSGDPEDADGDVGGDAPGSDTGAPEEPPVGPVVPVEPVVPLDAIPTDGGEAATCAAIVERLGTYREVALATGLEQVEALLQAMTEFENDIFTWADGHDWGDRIIEPLVTVRREWGNARSADRAGDTEAAQERATAAIVALDESIAAADCPT